MDRRIHAYCIWNAKIGGNRWRTGKRPRYRKAMPGLLLAGLWGMRDKTGKDFVRMAVLSVETQAGPQEPYGPKKINDSHFSVKAGPLEKLFLGWVISGICKIINTLDIF